MSMCCLPDAGERELKASLKRDGGSGPSLRGLVAPQHGDMITGALCTHASSVLVLWGFVQMLLPFTSSMLLFVSIMNSAVEAGPEPIASLLQ
jgi:hypothetical protein